MSQTIILKSVIVVLPSVNQPFHTVVLLVLATTVLSFTDDSPSSVTSEILNGAKIVYNDAQRVDVECYFKEQIEQHSCVLVYREYGNETIVVREYPQTTEFPVTATVSNNNYYTIAIFGKRNGFVDEEPIVSVENVNPGKVLH